MTKWSDPLQILITCFMEVRLRRLRLGFLVCVRPVSVSNLLPNPHLNSWHHFEGSLLELASLSQSNGARAVPKSAPCPDLALLEEKIQNILNAVKASQTCVSAAVCSCAFPPPFSSALVSLLVVLSSVTLPLTCRNNSEGKN